jgi:hypothetical protein
MIRSTTKFACVLAAGIVVALMGARATAAAWESCGQWASWSNGGYTLYNNVWGSGAGWQCIWANNGSNWGVSANHGSGGGIKSYPNSTKWLNKNTNNTPWAGTWFSVGVPGSGAYTSTFDVWGNGTQYEVMIWMNKQGAIGAIGSLQASNQSIGGRSGATRGMSIAARTAAYRSTRSSEPRTPTRATWTTRRSGTGCRTAAGGTTRT